MAVLVSLLVIKGNILWYMGQYKKLGMVFRKKWKKLIILKFKKGKTRNQ